MCCCVCDVKNGELCFVTIIVFLSYKYYAFYENFHLRVKMIRQGRENRRECQKFQTATVVKSRGACGMYCVAVISYRKAVL